MWRFSFLCVICGSRWICRRNWSESKSSNGWKMPPGNVQNLRPCFGRNLHPQDARPRAPTRQSRSLEVAFFAAPSFQLRWEMGLCKIPSLKFTSENRNFGSIQREQRATHHYFCKKCFFKFRRLQRAMLRTFVWWPCQALAACGIDSARRYLSIGTFSAHFNTSIKRYNKNKSGPQNSIQS